MPKEIPIGDVVWSPDVYPRAKYNTSTIERYADALEAGDDFPPLVLEEGTNVLLDGKHRLEAHKKAERATVMVEHRKVPDGMTAKYFAATLSARHGDRMSNGDLKTLAREEFEVDPAMNVSEWGRRLGVAQQTVQGWVGDIVNRGLEERRAKAFRLSKLGWTQEQIASRLEVSQPTINGDIRDTESGISDIRDALGRGLTHAEVATRWNLPIQVVWQISLEEVEDEDRLKKLGIKVQPYDVWQFPSCHDLMGDRHPGRIPGELVCHVLYFFTKVGDLVVDPMAGSGTTLDACLLMGRKARGYDIDSRHDRVDIERHNLDDGWPDAVAKASLVFWDPPYFDKMDNATIGDDGYIAGSISGLGPDGYLDWFAERFKQLHQSMTPGAHLAFLMSDWDSENAKQHAGHPGIFLWDYVDRLRDAGFTMKRQIHAPLSTQQVHPDIVNKFRASRRLARLERYLLVAQA
jgi:transcriptional regulator with XRE-family HTH domain